MSELPTTNMPITLPPLKPGERGIVFRELTPEKSAAIVSNISDGAHLETAARAEGIPTDLLGIWLKLGNLYPDTVYSRFILDIEQAAARHEIQLIRDIKEIGKEDWHASAQILDRRYPERWGKKSSVEHTGAGGGPIQIQKLSTTQTDVMRQQMERLNDPSIADNLFVETTATPVRELSEDEEDKVIEIAEFLTRNNPVEEEEEFEEVGDDDG